jgi:hypothetical protein
MKIGALEVIVKDVKNLFVEHFVWPAVKMGLIYEKRYLLGTSLARPCISLALMGEFLRFGVIWRLFLTIKLRRNRQRIQLHLHQPRRHWQGKRSNSLRVIKLRVESRD